jgi:hypothetical protein
MTKNLTRGNAATGLLHKLTASPALPAYIRSLEAPVLKRLVEHVGIADATELIVHSTATQMHDLFEVVLWESLEPGRLESHRPEKFLEWLDAMLGAGERFTGERLVELGEDFITNNFAPLLQVYNTAVMLGHVDEDRCDCITCRLDARDTPWEVVGDYLVAAEHADESDSIQSAVSALDAADSGCLQRILARLCKRVSARGYSDDGEFSRADAAAERQQRRESAGYVTPELAAIFLRGTALADFDVLAAETAYDEITATWMKRRPDRNRSTAEVASTTEENNAAAEDADAFPLSGSDRARLDHLLREGEILQDTPRLLAAPEQETGYVPELFVPEIQHHLDRLQWQDPTAFHLRLAELVHLANVLVAGSRFKGGRFEGKDAAHAALATANLGLDLLLSQQGITRPGERQAAIESQLAGEPGVIRLFRLGWHALQSLPLRCGQALVDTLHEPELRAGLSRRAWILGEIDSAISDPDIRELIRQGEFEDVSDNLHLLSLILDLRACRCLQVLIADWPQYPVQLDVGFGHARLDNREVRFISTTRQLDRIMRFIERLDTCVRLDT